MRLAAGGAALALAIALVAAPHARAETTLHGGGFRLGGGDAPPAEGDSAWAPVRLPDRWPETRPAASGSGWYRLAFSLEAVPTERQAVYVEHASMNAAVWLNGEWIGAGGRMRPPVAQSWNRPLLFDFSPRLLRVGENVVHVQLFGCPTATAASARCAWVRSRRSRRCTRRACSGRSSCRERPRSSPRSSRSRCWRSGSARAIARTAHSRR